MRKKVITKVLLQYKKKIRFKRVSKVSFEHVIEYARPTENPCIGIRYNSDKNEMIIGGSKSMQVSMRDIIVTWFNGTVTKIVQHEKRSGRACNKVRVYARVNKSGWKAGKAKLLRMKINGDKEWKVQFNINLSNIMN